MSGPGSLGLSVIHVIILVENRNQIGMVKMAALHGKEVDLTSVKKYKLM